MSLDKNQTVVQRLEIALRPLVPEGESFTIATYLHPYVIEEKNHGR